MAMSMLTNTIEHDPRRTGIGREEVYTAIHSFVEKFTFAMGPLIIGFAMQIGGSTRTCRTKHCKRPKSARPCFWGCPDRDGPARNVHTDPLSSHQRATRQNGARTVMNNNLQPHAGNEGGNVLACMEQPGNEGILPLKKTGCPRPQGIFAFAVGITLHRINNPFRLGAASPSISLNTRPSG